jgi:predicted dehydrogenase
MRVGIVGAGLQASRRGPILQQFPQTEVVVVSAAHLEEAEKLAARLGCDAAQGWESVVSRDDLDAVIVATPPHLHAEVSVAALRHGMHVLCEKPLARTLDEAKEMVAEAEAAGRVLKCGFNHRHHPAIQQARRWYGEGRIGDAVFVRARYGIGGRPGYEREWRANPEVVSGGPLMEQGIHVVDLARWFLGEFSQVTSLMGTNFWNIKPLEDNAFALYRTATGTAASIHSSLTQWKNLFSFELSGQDGYITAEGLGGSYGTEKVALGKRDFTSPFSEEVVEFRGEDRSWYDEWQEFMSAINEGREPTGSAVDGLEAMRLVFAAYESAKTGRMVEL